MISRGSGILVLLGCAVLWSTVALGEAQAATGAAGDGLILRAPSERLLLTAGVDPTPDVPPSVAPERLVAVVLSVENDGRRTVEVDPGAALAVVDTSGQLGQRRDEPCGRVLERVRLRSEQRRGGCVLFELPFDAPVASIRYTLEGSDGAVAATGEWRVAEGGMRADGARPVMRYPKVIRRNFLRACNRSSRGKIGICRCSLTEIEKRYALRAFERIDRRMRRRRARLPAKMNRIVRRCVERAR